jgi:hypothetical protein
LTLSEITILQSLIPLPLPSLENSSLHMPS